MSGNGKDRAHGAPTKEFFVRMITRDISLRDCILDLIDNSVDGARRTQSSGADAIERLAGYKATVTLSSDFFQIADNCGGISLDDAVDYAFHFGRRKDAPAEVEGTIGLYGIGMKRAIFKVGRMARVESHHRDGSFVVLVDVAAWEARPDDWDFEIEAINPIDPKGTTIRIDSLEPRSKLSFADPTFSNELIKTVGRDYAFVLQKGFTITIGQVDVPDYAFRVKQSAELTPAVVEYEDNGVSVKLVVGLIDELTEEVPDELRTEDSDRFGWYIVCNDRVVVAGDKTNVTVWGDDFQVWHNQYNGFGGFLFLQSDDPKKLPWTTTKRNVDADDPLYLRAKVQMKALTRQFIDYTNTRRADPETARESERRAVAVSVGEAAGTGEMRFPTVPTRVGPETVTIQYKREKEHVKEVAEALGDRSMAAREVGKRTFEYFRKMELSK